MKKVVMILLLAIMASSIGCSNNNIEIENINTYVENSDYQYSFCDLTTGEFTVQKGADGYYFSMNNFLYYADESNMTAVPVCNKNDCLHDKEPDELKKADCNAFLLDTLLNSNFYFANNKIYTLKDESYYQNKKLIIVNSIYEAQPDGTQRKRILKINKQILRWIIHRGVIYYVTDADNNIESFNLADNSNKVYLDLDSIGLYEPQLNNLFAYANNIYLCVSGYQNKEEFNQMINGDDIAPYENIYVYNTDGEQNYALKSDFSRNGLIYQGFIDDCMLYTDGDYDKKIKNLYSLDQNGKKTKIDYKFDNIYDFYYADNTFTYIKKGETIDDLEKNIFNVYDKNGNLITTIDFPDGFANEFFIGDDKYIFYLEDRETGIKLHYIDKENLKEGKVEINTIFILQN